ncbi:hypothetical protein SNE40_019406 [Patella caerulea]|uniref:PiggyBac transposable element-derived protein domain-containing protein n=1 Tax=Patella caerulea TaxID=87958 RepID=A0AAN8J9E4_PATCE
MFDKQIYVTGTVRSNRKNLPDEVKQTMKKKGDLIEMRRDNLLTVNWVDRKQVRFLSTFSASGTVDKISFDQKVNRIPLCVIDYNSGMGEVDLADMMTDYYAAEFKTLKCWKKVAFHLLDRCMTNAYILYKANPNLVGRPITHLKFITHVVDGLIGGYAEERIRVDRPSILPLAARRPERHFIDFIPEKKRLKCQVCARKRSDSCKGTRVRTWCRDCCVGHSILENVIGNNGFRDYRDK